MTEKELHKLTRQDLLELLLAQSKEVARQQTTMQAMETEREQTKADFDRLKAKLNHKDTQIERLKGKLDQKDRTIASLEKQMEEWRAGKRSELMLQVDQIRASAERMKRALRQKEGQIQELKQQLALREREAVRTVPVVAETEKRPEPMEPVRYDNDYLLDALSEREQRIQELNRQLRRKESELQSLGMGKTAPDGRQADAAPLQRETLVRLNELLEAVQDTIGQCMDNGRPDGLGPSYRSKG